jgi:hypothetical protein
LLEANLVKGELPKEMIELDHIFIFTSTGAREAEALIEHGLEEGPGNVHPGQGTSNRRFFFRQNFLELLWVHNEEEVRSTVIAPTRLWERSRWRQTGHSPFGICVRPSADLLSSGQHRVLPETWGYKPPYLPSGLQIDVARNEAYPQEPMLFQIPFSGSSKKKDLKPTEKVNHSLGVKNITRVILHMPALQPGSAAMKTLLTADWLEVEPEERFHLTLEFDRCQQRRIRVFAPDLPLTIKW